MAVRITITSVGRNISDLLNIYVSPSGSSWTLFSIQSKTTLLAGYEFTPPHGTLYYEVRDQGSCGTIWSSGYMTTTTTTTIVGTTTTTTTTVPTTTTTTTVVPTTTTTTVVPTTTTTTVVPTTTTTTTTIPPVSSTYETYFHIPIPIACGSQTYPYDYPHISATDIGVDFFSPTINGSDIEYISVNYTSNDEASRVMYNNSLLITSEVLYVSGSNFEHGDIYHRRLSGTTYRVESSIYFQIKLVGIEPLTEQVRARFVMEGCTATTTTTTTTSSP